MPPKVESEWAHRLRQVAFGLLCLMPLLLVVTRAGADIACVGIGLLLLLRSALEKDWRWVKKPEIAALLCLWVFLMATAGQATFDPEESLRTATIWGRFVLFYAGVRYWLLTSRRSLEIVSSIGVAVLVLVAIDTAWQYMHGVSLSGRALFMGERLTGPLRHANVGNWMLKIGLPMVGIFLYSAAQHRERRRIACAVAGLLVVMGLIFVTGERSISLLAMMSAAIIGGLLFLFWGPSRRWVILYALCAVLMLMGLMATQKVVQERGKFLAQQMSDFWSTPYGQLYLSAGILWNEHKLTGIGPHQFVDACPTMMNKMDITYCDIHPHNLYLEWLVVSGLIGFSLFVFAMASILWRVLPKLSFKGDATLLSAFTCGTLAVVLFPLIVTQSQFSNWPAILFWYTLALGASLPRLLPGKEKKI